MVLFLKLLLWLVPIAGNVYVDSSGRKPNYIAAFCVRGFLAICHGYLFSFNHIREYTPLFLFQVTSFWLLFEWWSNIVQKKPHPLYYDHRELDSGWIDKFFARIYFKVGHHRYHTAAKVLALLVMVGALVWMGKCYT
jgi:hypothetical protein